MSQVSQTSPESQRLTRLLGLANATVEAVHDKALARLGISAAQYSVLSMFAGRAWTCTQLSNALSHDAGALSRMLWRLECKQMINRLPVAGDRRSMLFELTEHGATVLEAGHAASCVAAGSCFGGLSNDELKLLTSVLSKLLAGAPHCQHASGDPMHRTAV